MNDGTSISPDLAYLVDEPRVIERPKYRCRGGGLPLATRDRARNFQPPCTSPECPSCGKQIAKYRLGELAKHFTKEPAIYFALVALPDPDGWGRARHEVVSVTNIREWLTTTVGRLRAQGDVEAQQVNFEVAMDGRHYCAIFSNRPLPPYHSRKTPDFTFSFHPATPTQALTIAHDSVLVAGAMVGRAGKSKGPWDSAAANPMHRRNKPRNSEWDQVTDGRMVRHEEWQEVSRAVEEERGARFDPEDDRGRGVLYSYKVEGLDFRPELRQRFGTAKRHSVTVTSWGEHRSLRGRGAWPRDGVYHDAGWVACRRWYRRTCPG